jgi:molybdenum cofactor cytidylyltransferase
MRLVEVSATAPADVAALVGGVVSHDVRHPQRRQQVLIRKGSALTEAALRQVLDAGAPSLHVLVPEPGDVPEDEAAARLGRAVAGPGVRVAAPHHGQAALRAAHRGWLEINQASLAQANACEGVLVFTVDGERAVDRDGVVGATKSAPLLLPQRTLDAVGAAVRATGPVVAVRPFQPWRIALVLTSRVQPAAQEQARAHLGAKVSWLGSTLLPAPGPGPGTVQELAARLRAALDQGADLLLVAGGSATDPSDLVFEGLRRAGGTVDRVGVPVDPGTACWIGRLDDRPVFGLASCELFGRAGAFDLVLPRVLAGAPLDAALLRSLAFGGLVAGGAPRIPDYTTD